jgi:hypothetical protein
MITYNCIVKGRFIRECGHSPFDSTIHGAVWVLGDFVCHVVDGFGEGLPLYIFKIWTMGAFDEYSVQMVRFP